MIYVDNSSAYPQRIAIPRDDEATGATHIYQFQSKDYDINHNGETYIYPDEGYDGITGGTINVHVPTDTQEAYDQGYSDGFSSGVTEGKEIQKAKLGELTATTNGHYASEDGYKDVYVDVEGGGGDVDYILLSQDYITSSAIGVGVNIGVTANTQWVVADYPDWMIFSPTAGTGTSTFYVQPQANTGESRVGVITLTGGTATRSIMVNQEGFNSYTGNTVSFVLYLGSPEHKSITLFDSSALQYVSGLKIDGVAVTPNTVISLPTQKSSNLTWSVEVELNTTEIQAPFFLPEPVDGTATFFWIDNIMIGDGITLIDGGIFDFFAPNGQGTAKYPYPLNITLGASITSVTSNFMYIDRYGLRNITSYAVNAPLISADTFVPLDNTKFSNFYVPQCSDYSNWETIFSNAGATYQMHYFDNVIGCSYSDGYDDGFEDGEEAMKSLLGQFTASTNGVYTSETGYSAITISVPTSAGTNIPITAVTQQEYSVSGEGTYNFSFVTGDTIRRLIVYFPQPGGTRLSAWYQDPDGSTAQTMLYPYEPLTQVISSMTIDDGPNIAPSQYYLFGDGNEHKVSFYIVNELQGFSFSDITSLTRVDASERFTTNPPYCQGCTNLRDMKAKRIEHTGSYTFFNCSNYTPIVKDEFPLLSSIEWGAFAHSGVRSLGYEIELDTIGGEAFNDCQNLYDCDLRKVKNVESGAFRDCSFTEAILPQVDDYYIHEYCFYLNANLTTVRFEIPDTGVGCNGKVNYKAFQYCSSFSTWNVYGEVPVPTIVDDNGYQTSTPFDRIPSSGTLDLMGAGRYIQAWRTFAATYLPGWTVQEAN